MNTRNVDLITFVVFLFVIVFLVGPFLRLVGGFLSIPPMNIVTVAVGAVWFLFAAAQLLRGSRSTLGSTKVTYWRGERIETRRSSRQRVRAASNVQLAVAVGLIALGLGCAYAAVMLLGQLVGVL